MLALSISIEGLALAVVVLLAALLGWAAHERGLIHREWARRRSTHGLAALPAADWWAAIEATAGCL